MSPPGSNGAAGYRVVYPEVVRQQVRAMRASIQGPAARRRFTQALRAIHQRLRNDPLVFGEHRNHLAHAQVALRVGGVGPLVVRYAVHDVQPLVFVLNVYLLSGPGV
jgi:hypothetical protein